MSHPEVDGDLLANRIDRDALHLQVYRQLSQAITSGGYRPGAEVTLRSLADAMGTSEMPVRDAVRRLIAERALEMRPGRRLAVPVLSATQFQEILRLRVLLESEAAEAACRLATKALIAQLRAIHSELVTAGEAGESRRKLWSINRRFHFAVYVASQMPLLVSFIETLWLQIGPLFNHLSVDLGRKRATNYHAAVLAALDAKDAKAAAAAIRADLSSAGELILEELEKQETSPKAQAG
jgi:DNA-binding GntR family transcriptional regulator